MERDNLLEVDSTPCEEVLQKKVDQAPITSL